MSIEVVILPIEFIGCVVRGYLQEEHGKTLIADGWKSGHQVRIMGGGALTCFVEEGQVKELQDQQTALRASREAVEELAGIVYDLARGDTPPPVRVVLAYQKAALPCGLRLLKD